MRYQCNILNAHITIEGENISTSVKKRRIAFTGLPAGPGAGKEKLRPVPSLLWMSSDIGITMSIE